MKSQKLTWLRLAVCGGIVGVALVNVIGGPEFASTTRDAVAAVLGGGAAAALVKVLNIV